MIVNTPDAVFAALASSERRQIIAFLAQTALATSELAARFGMSAPAVSRHLSVLAQAGLVKGERQGQKVLYRLNREALLRVLAQFASEVDGPLRRSPAVKLSREAL
jgi:DNA-binding transcriptional ArsR family regulator